MYLASKQNTPVVITLRAEAANGDTLTYEVVGFPTNGTLSGAGAEITYEPDSGFTGTDTFTYCAFDGQARSNAATVSVAVEPAMKGGSVWTWDRNNDGQLGHRAIKGRTTPSRMRSLTDVETIAVGRYHVLALKTDGTVWAWGRNRSGQLGDGTAAERHIPVRVESLTAIASIAAGCFYSLALDTDGTVWAWGSYGGELGGDTTVRSVPTPVEGLTHVAAVAAGGHHALALNTDGTVWAWGRNNSGQLGDGTTELRYGPVRVAGLTRVVFIAAGYHHSLALTADGDIWTWGNNRYGGQLGDGTITNRPSPVRVQGLAGVTAVSAGGGFSLAVTADGTVWAWGVNHNGELGDGTKKKRATPIRVSVISRVKSVACADCHCLGLKWNGTVWAWGWCYREPGTEARGVRRTPVRIEGLKEVTAIAAGGDCSFALTNEETPEGEKDAPAPLEEF